jgi:hypothetical protein
VRGEQAVTVATLVSSDSWVSAGTLAPRTIPFPFIALDDVLITYTDDDGVVDTLVRGTDYTITGNNRAGTAVFTPLVTFAAGGTFKAERDTRALQEYETERSTPLNADSIERELDRQAMRNLEQDARATALAARTPKTLPGQIAPDFDITDLGEDDLLVLKDGKLQRFAREPFAGKYYAGGAGGKPVPSSGLGGGDLALRTDLADDEAGALLVAKTGGGSVQDHIDEIVGNNQSYAFVSKFGNDEAALQAAINTGAREVIINIDVTVRNTVTLRTAQKLRGEGGKIIVPADHSIGIGSSVLYKLNGANIDLVNIEIDASATSGVRGIQCPNATGLHIWKPKLKKCNILLESSDNTVPRTISVVDHDIDMAGYLATAVYVSGVLGWVVTGGGNRNGLEGVATYNATRSGVVEAVKSQDHTQDGFLLNSGQDISFVSCTAVRCGQSGFTTQRQVAGTDTRSGSWTACVAIDCEFDAFDIRGRNSGSPYGIDTMFTLTGCIAKTARFCGFYIVLAEGTTVTGCIAYQCKVQGLLVDNSDRVIVDGFRAISCANDVGSGANKAGMLVFNSNGVQINGAVSGNWEGTTQQYGVSFTGTSARCRVNGGDFSNNSTGPFFQGTAAIQGAFADTLAGVGVFFLAVTERGRYLEEGYGPPTHTRPLGSTYHRLDGGGEVYQSNGGGVWRAF